MNARIPVVRVYYCECPSLYITRYVPHFDSRELWQHGADEIVQASNGSKRIRTLLLSIAPLH